MADETQRDTGKQVPDTATTYERAKPDVESPSKSLELPTTAPPHQKDKLEGNEKPRSPKQIK